MQDHVAGQMTIGVIHLLEKIDIDHQKREPAIRTPCVAEFLFESLDKEALIIDVCDGVHDRHLIEFLMENVLGPILKGKFKDGR